jgi:hypothetical protein
MKELQFLSRGELISFSTFIEVISLFKECKVR